MAIDITITQTGLFKKPLTEDILPKLIARFAELTKLSERIRFDSRHVLVRVDDVGALVKA